MSLETRQETIKKLLTCGICRKLCREFTIIDECCHTFCKKCITKKITEENLRNCPKCNADLGCAPLQKLKQDYRWQNLRNNYVEIRTLLIEKKIMKPRAKDLAREAMNEANKPPVVAALDVKGKGKEVDQALDQADLAEPPVVDRKGKGKLIEPSNEEMEFELVPLADPSRARRKEKSLSSLVCANPTSNPAPARAKRKYTRRKPIPPRRASLSGMEPIEVDMDHSPGSNNQLENPYALEPSKQQMTNNNSEEHGGEPLEGMNKLLKPLDELAEVVGKSKPRRSAAKKSAASEVKTGEADGIGSASVATGPRKPRRGRPRKEEKNGLAEDLNIPTQVVVDSSCVCGRNRQIWFQLVACKKQESSGLLASMPPRYLMVQDVNMPASFIKKYLVVKLGLESEDEVEISMRGQPIHPDMQMHQLIEMWIKTATRPERKKIVAVGSSGKDFVMVFTYNLLLQR